MRYKIYVFFMLFLMLVGINSISVRANKDYVVFIDPGHGGIDPGAIYKDIYEKDINLSISFKLKELLEQENIKVYMTRSGDYDLAVTNAQNRKRSDLSRRSNIINRSGSDLYVSIHLNMTTSSTWYGAQVFYSDNDPNNEYLASLIQKQLAKDTQTKRKISMTNEMYLHNRIEIPGVLVEAGFLSNPNERYLLKTDDYQYKLAKSIKEGIVKYLYFN